MSKLKNQYFTYAGIKRLVNKTLILQSKIAANPNEEAKKSRIEAGVIDLICQKLQSDCENYVIKLNKLAKHTGRSTIRVKDLELLTELRE